MLIREIFFEIVWEWLDAWEIEGDYVEFGVGNGTSLILAINGFAKCRFNYTHIMPKDDDEMCNLLKKKGSFPHRRFYGFDSFRGLPPFQEEDKNPVWEPGNYSFTKDYVFNNLKRHGIEPSKTILIEGYYNDILSNKMPKDFGIKKIAFAHIDVDLYSSCKLVLNFIKPAFQTGSILLFDDYFTYKGDIRKGEQGAFRKFIAENKHIHFEFWQQVGLYSRAFITTRLGEDSHEE